MKKEETRRIEKLEKEENLNYERMKFHEEEYVHISKTGITKAAKITVITTITAIALILLISAVAALTKTEKTCTTATDYGIEKERETTTERNPITGEKMTCYYPYPEYTKELTEWDKAGLVTNLITDALAILATITMWAYWTGKIAKK